MSGRYTRHTTGITSGDLFCGGCVGIVRSLTKRNGPRTSAVGGVGEASSWSFSEPRAEGSASSWAGGGDRAGPVAAQDRARGRGAVRQAVWEAAEVETGVQSVSGVLMNRDGFLNSLRQLWKANLEMGEPLTIDDLLDDAASLGVAGASEMYGILLKDGLDVPVVGNIDPETGAKQKA